MQRLLYGPVRLFYDVNFSLQARYRISYRVRHIRKRLAIRRALDREGGDPRRECEKSSNYRYRPPVLYSVDKRIVERMRRRNCLAGTMVYSRNGKEVASDLIFPKQADEKYNYRLRNRLLAQSRLEALVDSDAAR